MAEAVQRRPLLYGVLTKTVYTAQAHFAARHASAKHKNKLTEKRRNSRTLRCPTKRDVDPEDTRTFPSPTRRFVGEVRWKTGGTIPVRLSGWPLSFLSSTSTDYGQNTKMPSDQVCRRSPESSPLGLSQPLERLNVSICGIQVRNEVAVTWSPPLGPSVVAFVL